MKLAKNRERNERASPVATSKMSPATITSCISSSLCEALKFATYLVIAEFMPQSLNKFIMVEGTNAIP